MLNRLKQWARDLKRDVVALWLPARDPRVPWPAKLIAALVGAYALSPIDLMPDFVPVLGYLDDLLIVPLGIALAMRLIPPEVMIDLRGRAAMITERPTSRIGLAFVLAIWFGIAARTAWLLMR